MLEASWLLPRGAKPLDGERDNSIIFSPRERLSYYLFLLSRIVLSGLTLDILLYRHYLGMRDEKHSSKLRNSPPQLHDTGDTSVERVAPILCGSFRGFRVRVGAHPFFTMISQAFVLLLLVAAAIWLDDFLCKIIDKEKELRQCGIKPKGKTYD